MTDNLARDPDGNIRGIDWRNVNWLQEVIEIAGRPIPDFVEDEK